MIATELARHFEAYTNPDGVTPFGPIAIRWLKNSSGRPHPGLWCAMNTIEGGWSSQAVYTAPTLPEVLSKLNVVAVAVKCDEHSLYWLCEPGAPVTPKVPLQELIRDR